MQTNKVEKKMKKTIANIPDILVDTKDEVLGAVHQTADNYVKSVKSSAQNIEKDVKAQPWKYMAGVAVAAFVAGYGISKIQGKKKFFFTGSQK